MLYNVPGRTGVNIEPATVKRLSAIDTIVGVKEASGGYHLFDGRAGRQALAHVTREDEVRGAAKDLRPDDHQGDARHSEPDDEEQP